MTILKGLFAGTVLAGAAIAAPAIAAPYYLFDGDSSRAVEIDNGAVVKGFDTFQLGYPVAITNTIWLGGRDNQGATQYSLDGTATGATSPGGNLISQLLDGTTNGVNNFGVTCCRGQNVVTMANADWSNQQILFPIAGDSEGIAFDTLSNSLYISTFNQSVVHYAIDGTVLDSFQTGTNLAALAYDQSSDSLWGWNRNTSSLEQYSLSGARLQSQAIDVGAFGIFNPFGGEMAISVAGVPEPATWAMMLGGFGLVGAAMRKRSRTTMAYA